MKKLETKLENSEKARQVKDFLEKKSFTDINLVDGWGDMIGVEGYREKGKVGYTIAIVGKRFSELIIEDKHFTEIYHGGIINADLLKTMRKHIR